MRASVIRQVGFVQQHLDMASHFAAKAVSVGGMSGPMPEVVLANFSNNPEEVNRMKVFSDSTSLGGYSRAVMTSETFKPGDLPEGMESFGPRYAKFSGHVSIDLPPERPDVDRSGFAAWRTPDPRWTLFGKANFNCEAMMFLALRLKSDGSKYYINLQSDELPVKDLLQHRLFAKKPGQWETVFVPFQDFVRTNVGQAMKKQGWVPKAKIKSVGLGLIDRIPGPFELCIERIWATNKREFYDETEDPII